MPCSTVVISLLTLVLVMECYCLQHHRHRTVPGCTRCRPGRFVVFPCDPLRHRDTECGSCPEGTYSPHHSYARFCYPCARCGDGLYVAHACTPFRDTVCDSCHTFKGPHNRNYQVRCGGVSDDPSTRSDADGILTSGSKEPIIVQAHPTQQEVSWVTPVRAAHLGRKHWSSSGSDPDTSPSWTIFLTVLLLSAAVSFVLFGGVAAITLARRRTSAKDKKFHLGRLYSSVETTEAVML